MDSTDFSKVFDMIVPEKVLQLEQKVVQIPSPTFQEQELADYLANYMSDIGLDVEMQDVHHPFEEKKSRQPIGKLKGTGEGTSLMLNAHMDPCFMMSGWKVDPYGGKYEDGWIYGAGAMDSKGGIVAGICAIEALKRSGSRLKGDILMCPVVAHKAGGIGTRDLIKKGILTDYCINLEHSANGIATVCVGIVKGKIITTGPGLFYRSSPDAKARYFNSIEQQTEIIRRMGPSLAPLPEGKWLRFSRHPKLLEFPQIRYEAIHKEPYPRNCSMEFQIRTVPGQTLESVREDIEGLLKRCKSEMPNLNYELAIPAQGKEDTWYMDPMEIPEDHPLVVALANGHRLVTNTEPIVGSETRLGNVGDGNLLPALGVATVQYGPGDIRIYKEWPTPNECVKLHDLVSIAKVVAYAASKLCG